MSIPTSCMGNSPVCFPSPSIDCWKCPVITDRIRVAEEIFRHNIEITKRLREYVLKFSDYLIRDYGKDYIFKIMDFCGTHEWTIVHFGIRSLVLGMLSSLQGRDAPPYALRRLITLSRQLSWRWMAWSFTRMAIRLGCPQ